MSILIKKNSGSYHIINKALYETLMSKDVLIENGDYIDNKNFLIEADTSFNELIKSMLRQNNYRIDTLKEKDQQPIINSILELIGDDISTTNIKNAVKTFIDNEKAKQEAKPKIEPSNLLNKNTQTNNTKTDIEEPNKSEENSTSQEKNNDTFKINPELQKFNNIKDESYKQIMKEYGYLDDIIKLANKGEGQQYTAETIPQNVLYKYAENYKPYRNRLLTTRFINQLKNLNVPDHIKNDLIDLYKENEKTRGSIRNILSSPQIKQRFESKYQSAYDFPIGDYYINKYNKNKSRQILNRMANEVIKFADEKTGYRKELKKNNYNAYINLKNFILKTKNNINYDNSNKKELKKEIIEKLKTDFNGNNIIDIVNNYNVLNNTNIDPYDDNANLFDIYNSDSLIFIKLKDEVLNRIQSLLKMLGMLPWIDYVITPQPFSLTDIIEDKTNPLPQNSVVRIQVFSDYSMSKIIGQITNDDELKEKWKISVPTKKLSVIYDDYYHLEFKLRDDYYEEYNIDSSKQFAFKISFIKGFYWLEVIDKGFNKGKQKARQWKG